MYMAQLRSEFEARTGGTWPLNVRQVCRPSPGSSGTASSTRTTRADEEDGSATTSHRSRPYGGHGLVGDPGPA